MVVLDIWRGMTGLELQEELRAPSAQTSAIIMTGRVAADATNKALNAGTVAFFVKRFDKQQFLSAVRNVPPDRT